MAGDLGGKHLDLAGGELPEPSLGVPQLPDPGREVDVDLVEGSAGLLAGRRFEILDAGEGTPASARVRILIRSMACCAV